MAALRFHIFAPADRRWRRRSGSASGSEGERAEAAARAARRGRLETVQKVCTDRASRPETDPERDLDDDLDEGPFMSGSA
jgi:hypothetical protein